MLALKTAKIIIQTNNKQSWEFERVIERRHGETRPYSTIENGGEVICKSHKKSKSV
jgi:hypothetical protein